VYCEIGTIFLLVFISISDFKGLNLEHMTRFFFEFSTGIALRLHWIYCRAVFTLFNQTITVSFLIFNTSP
jgi:hypothetical protein